MNFRKIIKPGCGKAVMNCKVNKLYLLINIGLAALEVQKPYH